MVTAIGLVGGFLTTACWLPQVIKTMRLGDADEFAWLYLVMLMVGLTGWAIYGIARGDLPIALYNVITWLLVMVVVVIKVRRPALEHEEAVQGGPVH
ncbi:MAG TPA: PQ-loop domain-containing transporter [Acidimicrobiales bacterium]